MKAFVQYVLGEVLENMYITFLICVVYFCTCFIYRCVEFIVVKLCVFVILCLHCCFYFGCRTAGYKSVFVKSCDRPGG